MSYNIDRAFYLRGSLSIKRCDAWKWERKRGRNIPEINFLDRLNLEDDDPDELLPIESPSWSSEGSGHSFDLYRQILADTKGEADICLAWARGDSITGLRVRDGVVTECKATIVLE